MATFNFYNTMRYTSSQTFISVKSFLESLFPVNEMSFESLSFIFHSLGLEYSFFPSHFYILYTQNNCQSTIIRRRRVHVEFVRKQKKLTTFFPIYLICLLSGTELLFFSLTISVVGRRQINFNYVSIGIAICNNSSQFFIIKMISTMSFNKKI